MRLIIPSVGYADYLAETLPAWRAVLGGVICVVTAAHDRETFRCATSHHADIIVTDAWTRSGAVFNKAAALSEALSAAHVGEVCLVADADVVPFGSLPHESLIRDGVLYGAPRFECLTPDALRLHQLGVARLGRDLPLILPRQKGVSHVRLSRAPSGDELRQCASRGIGYLHAFRYRPGLSFGESQTAGGYDTRFARLFRERDQLPGYFYLLHLGPQSRENWKGRVLPTWGVA